MKKQEFVPRKISEKPLYELKSVEDIPVSELYQVKINGKEQRVYHTEFFDFVSFLDENEKAEVEVTVNEPSHCCTDTIQRRGEQNQHKPSCRKENYS